MGGPESGGRSGIWSGERSGSVAVGLAGCPDLWRDVRICGWMSGGMSGSVSGCVARRADLCLDVWLDVRICGWMAVYGRTIWLYDVLYGCMMHYDCIWTITCVWTISAL